MSEAGKASRGHGNDGTMGVIFSDIFGGKTENKVVIITLHQHTSGFMASWPKKGKDRRNPASSF